jgi:hypothetical protein
MPGIGVDRPQSKTATAKCVAPKILQMSRFCGSALLHRSQEVGGSSAPSSIVYGTPA